jgi:Raf kinase inhibitor-like YbhB/YbcL family protein
MRHIAAMLVAAVILGAFTAGAAEPMKISSPDIRSGDYIARQFTCQGMNIAPRLEFIDVPEGAKSLAVIVHDPDAPSRDWVHWVIFNIPPDEREITRMMTPGIEGVNDFGKKGWKGPCPPSGAHRYIFSGYALDVMLEPVTDMTREAFERAAQGHILAEAELTGLYERF